jgi:Rrf2 family transcriptional regulator, nitric oxide-sensitive transcriptional repressor
MKLTAFTDYSLRVLIYLAAEPDRRATIVEIASAYAVSENTLVKVIHDLGQRGWLRNVRGKGGGLELAMPPECIRLGEVLRETEGQSVVDCVGGVGGDCCIAPACRLRGILAEALGAFHAVLDGYTVADLARNAPQLAEILFIDRGTGAGASALRVNRPGQP